MKKNKDKKHNSPARSLSSKLLGYFIIYGLALLALLWLMQAVLLQHYYERSMSKKCQYGSATISRAYQEDENLDFEGFCNILGKTAFDNDLYIFLEAADGSFSISSSEVAGMGRIFPDSGKIISDARQMLINSAKNEIHFSTRTDNKDTIIVYARKLKGEYRNPAYLYAAASLVPLGPAVNIIRSQLLIVTLFVVVLGVVIAFLTSRHLAKPMVAMSASAKKLGNGDFDVQFSGSDYMEINELAQTLNDAASELKTSDQLRKDLMANVSHDLRTPLTMIKSYAELIRDLSGDDKEKRSEHLGVIIEESDRLSDLVGDILQLSKVQSGAEIFKEKRFDLCRACAEIVQTFRIMEQEGFSISESYPNKEVTVYADEAKIKQVISNMVSNAVKYSDKKKEIGVSIELADGAAVLSVCDKGIGIAEDQLDKIWDRYQRASARGSRAKGGTGLGLSICSEILKRSNAKYGVESKLGQGSRFWFSMDTVNEQVE